VTLRARVEEETEQLAFWARIDASFEPIVKPGNSVAATMAVSVNGKEPVDRIAKAIDAVPVWRNDHWSATGHAGPDTMEVVFVLKDPGGDGT
jgi:hypothetical protein